MKLVKASVSNIELVDPLKTIELAGRTCYKSEDKITEDSASNFVKMILNNGHLSVLEHSRFILQVDRMTANAIKLLEDREYISITSLPHDEAIISANARAFRELLQRTDLASHFCSVILLELRKVCPIVFDDIPVKAISKDMYAKLLTPKHILDRGSLKERLKHLALCYKIITDRGVTHEIVRHRPPSYSQESTRYCNYKGGVTFIIPPWFDLSEGEYSEWKNIPFSSKLNENNVVENATSRDMFLHSCWWAEVNYKSMLQAGHKAQEARAVLPNALKTEIVMTTNLQEWKHFFKLRTSIKAHPQMQEVANLILTDARSKFPGIFDVI